MAQRMSPHVHHLGTRSGAKGHGIAIAHGHVNAWNLVLFVGWSHNRHTAIGSLLKIKIATGVIVMMMRVEDVRQLPPALAQLLLNGGGAGRIDRGGLTRRGIMQEVAVVVVQAGELDHLER